jgi:hypothetical protein
MGPADGAGTGTGGAAAAASSALLTGSTSSGSSGFRAQFIARTALKLKFSTTFVAQTSTLPNQPGLTEMFPMVPLESWKGLPPSSSISSWIFFSLSVKSRRVKGNLDASMLPSPPAT